MSTRVVMEDAKSARSSSKKGGAAVWTAFLRELSPWRQSRAFPISRLARSRAFNQRSWGFMYG
ncbi:hypothetical protein SLEP1_g38684 [Rubroshorea leprosula]|uniref:Uncharacterized protein n=1 Tax=Rubroshorea leprosula TaxID=152421 RepID=A0AAV5KYG7_9ROSI|nr:hypothetical protein SLEP1_g38684 [Rubroshorea leprosula]